MKENGGSFMSRTNVVIGDLELVNIVCLKRPLPWRGAEIYCFICNILNKD